MKPAEQVLYDSEVSLRLVDRAIAELAATEDPFAPTLASTVDPSDEDALGDFIAEARGLIAGCEERLAQLEVDGEADHGERTAGELHALRGTASSLGLETISMLAHDAESLVKAARQARTGSRGLRDLRGALRALATILSRAETDLARAEEARSRNSFSSRYLAS
jgi:chemotaxis protein histidine kinase CheA